MPKIRIEPGSVTFIAELDSSRTAQEIYESLPFEGSVHIWGEEIYFEIPCDISLEPDAPELVEVGTLAYWPTGKALCIFFGRTPVSTDERPRAYSPVNVCGKLIGSYAFPEGLSEGASVRVSEHHE